MHFVNNHTKLIPSYFQLKKPRQTFWLTIPLKVKCLNKKKYFLLSQKRLYPEKCKHCHAIKTLLCLFKHPNQPSKVAPMVWVRVGSIRFVTNGSVQENCHYFLQVFLAKLYTSPLMTCQFKCGKPSGDGPVVCMCQHNLSVSIVPGASHASFHSHSLWKKKMREIAVY